MRLIHTADWHLGRLFHNRSLIEDQAHILEDLKRLLGEIRPDALIIAGDVYDRAVPPAEAVRLLNSTLTDIVIGLGIKVLMIAGNHDDADRLGFGSALLESRGLHVFGSYRHSMTPVTLEDDSGPVDFCLLPFDQGVPLISRKEGGNEDARDYDTAMRIACEAALATCESPRRVAVAHCFAAGSGVSDSERPLSVGGSDQVSPEVFRGFDYVALGHLHQPQSVGTNAAYSGSLLKYSFSEANHKKSVAVIDIDADGKVSRTTETLNTLRDLRIVEGSLDELIDAPPGDGDEDFLLARLTDTGALYDALARLRKRYPNILAIERTGLSFAHRDAGSGTPDIVPEKLTTGELFSGFFEYTTGTPASDEQLKAFAGILDAATDSGNAP